MEEAPASAPHHQRHKTGLQAAARIKPLIDPTDLAVALRETENWEPPDQKEEGLANRRAEDRMVVVTE